MTTIHDPDGFWDYQVKIQRVTAQSVNDRVDELARAVIALSVALDDKARQEFLEKYFPRDDDE